MIALMLHDPATHHELSDLLSRQYDLIIPRRSDELGVQSAGRYRLVLLDELRALSGGRCRLVLFDTGSPLWQSLRAQPLPGAPGLRLLALVEEGHLDHLDHALLQAVDDFVVRPFTVEELLQRVARLVQLPPEGSAGFQAGPFRLDLRTGEAHQGEGRLSLTRKELALLYALARRADGTVTRDELLNEVWGIDSESSSNVLDVCIRSLRRKIEPEPHRPQYIQTVRGVGYRLLLAADTSEEQPTG